MLPPEASDWALTPDPPDVPPASTGHALRLPRRPQPVFREVAGGDEARPHVGAPLLLRLGAPAVLHVHVRAPQGALRRHEPLRLLWGLLPLQRAHGRAERPYAVPLPRSRPPRRSTILRSPSSRRRCRRRRRG